MREQDRNATASWSGYLHQGKVGIFVALDDQISRLKEHAIKHNIENTNQ